MNSRLSSVFSVSYDTSSSSSSSSIISLASVASIAVGSRVRVAEYTYLSVRVSIRLSEKCATLLYSSRTVATRTFMTAPLVFIPRRPATWRDLSLFCARTRVPLDCAYLSAATYLYVCISQKEGGRETARETAAHFIPARNKRNKITTRLIPRLPRNKHVKLKLVSRARVDHTERFDAIRKSGCTRGNTMDARYKPFDGEWSV